jgi:nucleoside-diphosphate-sugar epimerase
MLANHLHQQGFELIGTSREPEKHADQVPFKLLRLDISDAHSVWFKTDIGHNAVSDASGHIADSNAYRKQADAATQKGIDEAQAPDAVVHTITQLINTKKPRFSNPVDKMTGMILFLQRYAPKLFERAILKSVKSA